jgi:nucleotidyltransferase/DNA polymerase involved in DNA repair
VDEAFLDLGGTRLLWPDPLALARDLKQRIADELHLTASAGLAPNKFLAKLASDLHKPDGLTVVPSDPAHILAFLAPLPVSRIWGVGTSGERRLHRFGLQTFRDVHHHAEDELRRWLGDSFGSHVWRLAHGIDDRPVETEREARSISAEHTYGEDCSDPNTVRHTLIELTEKVGWRLRRAGISARTGQLKLRFDDFKTLNRQRPFPVPTRTDADLLRCALDLYDQARTRQPIRLIGFGVSNFANNTSAVPVQTELFTDLAAPRNQALDRAVDSVRDRFGRDSLRRGGP